MGFPIHSRVRIGSGRSVWRTMHTGANEAGRVLVQSEKSGRMTTVAVDQLRAVR